MAGRQQAALLVPGAPAGRQAVADDCSLNQTSCSSKDVLQATDVGGHSVEIDHNDECEQEGPHHHEQDDRTPQDDCQDTVENRLDFLWKGQLFEWESEGIEGGSRPREAGWEDIVAPVLLVELVFLQAS